MKGHGHINWIISRKLWPLYNYVIFRESFPMKKPVSKG
jgi:hypothetical protein